MCCDCGTIYSVFKYIFDISFKWTIYLAQTNKSQKSATAFGGFFATLELHKPTLVSKQIH